MGSRVRESDGRFTEESGQVPRTYRPCRAANPCGAAHDLEDETTSRTKRARPATVPQLGSLRASLVLDWQGLPIGCAQDMPRGLGSRLRGKDSVGKCGSTACSCRPGRRDTVVGLEVGRGPVVCQARPRGRGPPSRRTSGRLLRPRGRDPLSPTSRTNPRRSPAPGATGRPHDRWPPSFPPTRPRRHGPPVRRPRFLPEPRSSAASRPRGPPPTPASATSRPSVLDFGPVRFKLARHFGFCFGVENAIEIAYRALDEHPDKAAAGRIFLLSEMIHNPHVNDDLLARGRPVPAHDRRARRLVPFSELGPGDLVIVPAFGAPTETLEARSRPTGRRRGVVRHDVPVRGPRLEKGRPDRAARATPSSSTASGTTRRRGPRSAGPPRPSPVVVVRDPEPRPRPWPPSSTGRQATPRSSGTTSRGRTSEGFDPARDLGRVRRGQPDDDAGHRDGRHRRASPARHRGPRRHRRRLRGHERHAVLRDQGEPRTPPRRSSPSGADLALVVGGYNSSNTSPPGRAVRGRRPPDLLRQGRRRAGRAPTLIRHWDWRAKTARETAGWLDLEGAGPRAPARGPAHGRRLVPGRAPGRGHGPAALVGSRTPAPSRTRSPRSRPSRRSGAEGEVPPGLEDGQRRVPSTGPRGRSPHRAGPRVRADRGRSFESSTTPPHRHPRGGGDPECRPRAGSRPRGPDRARPSTTARPRGREPHRVLPALAAPTLRGRGDDSWGDGVRLS